MIGIIVTILMIGCLYLGILIGKKEERKERKKQADQINRLVNECLHDERINSVLIEQQKNNINHGSRTITFN